MFMPNDDGNDYEVKPGGALMMVGGAAAVIEAHEI